MYDELICVCLNFSSETVHVVNMLMKILTGKQKCLLRTVKELVLKKQNNKKAGFAVD